MDHARSLPLFRGGLSYGEADGRDLLLDVLSPANAEARPLVVYVHGGGWHEGDRGAAMHPWLNPLLVSHGYVTASVTYRLSGEATWPAPLADVRAAIRWLRRHAEELGADPTRFGLWGHSAGAHLAALAALTAQPEEAVQAVALSACPADLRGESLASGSEVARLLGPDVGAEDLVEASPVCHVGQGAPPFLIAHGTEDDIVAPAQSEALRDALRAEGAIVEWVPIRDAGHDWADRPGGRGRAEMAGTFGALALPFFDRHIRRL